MSEFLLKQGSIVSSTGWRRGDIHIRNGRIQAMDARLSLAKPIPVIDCEGSYIYPGLINSHDHLEFNCYSHLGNPPYRNAYEWGTDLHSNWQSEIQRIERIPVRDRFRLGAWKNLFSGVTRVVHHNPHRWQLFFQFPVDVLQRYTFAHSLLFEPNLDNALRRRKKNVPFILHIAEGVDEPSSREVSSLQRLGGLDKRTVLVHAVGITEDDIRLVEQHKSAIIWCPSSNLYLFGKTAPVDSLRDRVPLALGTDSTLTGAETLFDELRIAKEHTTATAQQLFEMVTTTPRNMFQFSPDAGCLIQEGRADLFVTSIRDLDPFEQLLRTGPSDIRLCMRGGNVAFYQASEAALTFLGGADFALGERPIKVCDGSFASFVDRIRPHVNHYSYLHGAETPSHPGSKSFEPVPFCCPSCKRELRASRGGWFCEAERLQFETSGALPNFILPARKDMVEAFVRGYQGVRRREGWNLDTPARVRALPFRDLSGKHTATWKIRAQTYTAFMNLSGLNRTRGRTILDVGAGNCWLSARLASEGHRVYAVDVSADEFDVLELGGRRGENGSEQPVHLIRAEFDFLPFAGQYFDDIVFNASLHYSPSPAETVKRIGTLLKRSGSVWILDSPLFMEQGDGDAMVSENNLKFRLGDKESLSPGFAPRYLLAKDIDSLRHSFAIAVEKPKYGLAWQLRPLLSKLQGRHRPSSFVIIRAIRSEAATTLS